MAFYYSRDRGELEDPARLIVAGELIKTGVVSLQQGEEPEPHYHPNEEQFVMVLSGKLQMLVGDETAVVGPGDLVHIPRNVMHGIKVIEGPMVWFNCKSPVGNGDIKQDYTEAPNSSDIKATLGRD